MPHVIETNDIIIRGYMGGRGEGAARSSLHGDKTINNLYSSDSEN